MKRKITILTLMLLCFVKAYTQEVASKTIDCNNAKTQVEMNECAQKDFYKADKELNEAYKKITSMSNSETKQSLIVAQKKWLEYRDLCCKVYDKLYKGGSMMGMSVINCKTRMTNERVKELKIILDELDK